MYFYYIRRWIPMLGLTAVSRIHLESPAVVYYWLNSADIFDEQISSSDQLASQFCFPEADELQPMSSYPGW